MKREKTARARYKEGELDDGTLYKSWLVTCPFCQKGNRHSVEMAPGEVGYTTYRDDICGHARYFNDDGTVIFAKWF